MVWLKVGFRALFIYLSTSGFSSLSIRSIDAFRMKNIFTVISWFSSYNCWTSYIFQHIANACNLAAPAGQVNDATNANATDFRSNSDHWVRKHNHEMSSIFKQKHPYHLVDASP